MMYAAASACFLNIRTFWYGVYTGKSMVFGEVSPVQFSELMSQASPSDMQSVFHSGIEEGYSYGPAVCPRCGGQMGEKAYWDFC